MRAIRTMKRLWPHPGSEIPNRNLITLAASLKPNQAMADAIILELASGDSGIPAYAPFIVHRMSEPPRPVASNGHTAAAQRRVGNSRQAKRENAPQSIPLREWPLYQMRVLLTAEMVGAPTTFGGLATSWGHLAIALNIATTDSIAIAFAYGRLVNLHLEEKARARAETTLGGRPFSPKSFRLGIAPSRARQRGGMPPTSCAEGAGCAKGTTGRPECSETPTVLADPTACSISPASAPSSGCALSFPSSETSPSARRPNPKKAPAKKNRKRRRHPNPPNGSAENTRIAKWLNGPTNPGGWPLVGRERNNLPRPIRMDGYWSESATTVSVESYRLSNPGRLTIGRASFSLSSVCFDGQSGCLTIGQNCCGRLFYLRLLF